jgi:hypothetical protein
MNNEKLAAELLKLAKSLTSASELTKEWTALDKHLGNYVKTIQQAGADMSIIKDIKKAQTLLSKSFKALKKQHKQHSNVKWM